MRILLIGAKGNFGGRLAALLVREPGVELIAGIRRESTGPALVQAYGCEIALIDRDSVTATSLAPLRINLVIDASGPFQQINTNLVEACIGAGVHYCDIADGRRFVNDIKHFDDVAKATGVAVISGASSTPALSDAVVSHLTKDWQHIDKIRVAISPSNRQKRGRAVVAAILMGVGQKLELFRLGGWRASFGWGDMRRISFPSVGRRWASLCDTPDLDLLVTRHAPRVEASFYASLELSVMHVGLAFLGLFVRLRLLRSVLPLAGLLSWVADRLEGYGNDCGGMAVDVQGQARDGQACYSRWWLAAKGNIGPNVPILAALGIARQLRDGELQWRGARPCVGFLDLASFERDFTALGIGTGTEVSPPQVAAFRDALGSGFDQLPIPTQLIHSPVTTAVWRGEGTAQIGSKPFARLIAWALSFPNAPEPTALTVIIEQQPDGSEEWHRIWPAQIMRSRMANPRHGSIEEHFGPLAFTLGLTAHSEGLDMKLLHATLWGIRLPRFALPEIAATERAQRDRHLFDVAVALPIIGRLVHYKGWLAST